MYKLIVYKVINFKIPKGNKMINKRYFQKVYSTTGIEKELSKAQSGRTHWISAKHAQGRYRICRL